ncbi:MAG: MFS transporter [Chloroflexota bacterium]
MNLPAIIQRPGRMFYGWRMVALGGFVSSLSKTAVNKGFPVFILPVEETFGISRATVSLIFSLARGESGLTGPLDGWLVDRFGPRMMLFFGALMVGVGFLLLSQVPNIWAFGLVYMGLVTAGSNLGFSYSMSGLVNNWFHRQKALAMSAYQAIDSLLPAVLVPVLALGIALWGWRSVSAIVGIILLAVIPPLSFFIRNTPESMGLTSDGDKPTSGEGPVGASGGLEVQRQVADRKNWQPPVDYTVAAAMRTAGYWILVTATSLRLVAKGAIILHVIPILVSKGADEKTAASIFGLLLFITVPLYLAIGWLSDRFPQRLVLAAASASGTLSFALLASPLQSFWVILLFVFLFAIADASAPTNWAVLGDYFGKKTFNQLRGFVQLANFPGVLLAPVFVGWWYDHHQSYTVPLWIFTVVFGLGAIAFTVMRRPRQVEKATPVGLVGGGGGC